MPTWYATPAETLYTSEIRAFVGRPQPPVLVVASNGGLQSQGSHMNSNMLPVQYNEKHCVSPAATVLYIDKSGT